MNQADRPLDNAQENPPVANLSGGDRARRILAAWLDLTDDEQGHFAAYTLRQTCHMMPIAPFAGLLAEARCWAELASPAELDAYATAILEHMAPQRRAAFLDYANGWAAA